MFSFLMKQPQRTNTAPTNPLMLDGGRSSMDFQPLGSKCQIRVVVPPQATDDQLARGEATSKPNTVIAPPYHWHIYQQEKFDIIKGTMRATLEGKDIFAGAGETVIIPPRAFHTLRNASEKEEMVYELSYDPPNWPEIESFFRNLESYLEDCRKSGMAPSLIQEVMFLGAVDMVVALPGPKFLAMPLGLLMNVVLGKFVGPYLLGMKASYTEYHHESAQ